MDIKELVREKVFAEIIAERDGMILSQHHQIEALMKEIEALRVEKNPAGHTDKAIKFEEKEMATNV